MENVISVVGAAVVASVIGAFMMFECPLEPCVPKPEELQVSAMQKVGRNNL